MGFTFVATDGEIGHVDDFLVDENWNVRYLVVDTSNWIGGKSVLISPSKLEKVDSPDKQIRVRMSRSEIERSPSVDSASIELIETLPPVLHHVGARRSARSMSRPDARGSHIHGSTPEGDESENSQTLRPIRSET